MESEGEHKHPQYREIGPREVPTVLRRRDTDHGLPANDMVMVDIIQATAKKTGLEERMMFHIDPGMPRDGDQNDMRRQERSAYNWDIGIWSSSLLPASHLTKINEFHGRTDTQVSMDARIREPASDGISRSQHRQRKLPPELGLASSDNLIPRHVVRARAKDGRTMGC